ARRSDGRVVDGGGLENRKAQASGVRIPLAPPSARQSQTVATEATRSVASTTLTMRRARGESTIRANAPPAPAHRAAVGRMTSAMMAATTAPPARGGRLIGLNV